jgi:hypothetical protein
MTIWKMTLGSFAIAMVLMSTGATPTSVGVLTAFGVALVQAWLYVVIMAFDRVFKGIAAKWSDTHAGR